jgi:chorismate synthase
MTKKYGFRDYRGGGRSARETSRVVAGAIAKQMQNKNTCVCVFSRAHQFE